MKWLTRHRTSIVYTISLLYIILFVYAALNKFLEFDDFRIQLLKNPLLSAHAVWIIWLVPFLEILLAFALLFEKIRFAALNGALALMVSFTTYIAIIFLSGDDIPCFCGGVLDNMGWFEHLIFNFGFVIIGIVALYLYPVPKIFRAK